MDREDRNLLNIIFKDHLNRDNKGYFLNFFEVFNFLYGNAGVNNNLISE